MQGLHIAVYSSHGDLIIAESERCLGKIKDTRLQLVVTVGQERPYLTAFTLDGRRRVCPKRNDSHLMSECSMYRLYVPLSADERNGFHFTMPLTNNLRFLDAPDGGDATYGEVGVISQRGEFFLVEQAESVVCGLLDVDGKVVCSGLDGRPQIAEYLAKLYENRKIIMVWEN